MRCHMWEGNCVMTGDIQSVAGVRMRKESPNGECHGIPARPQYVLRDVIKGMYSTVRITEWNIDLTGEIPRCRDAAFHFPPLLCGIQAREYPMRQSMGAPCHAGKRHLLGLLR